jgi:FtsH-binding integral membrane protein
VTRDHVGSRDGSPGDPPDGTAAGEVATERAASERDAPGRGAPEARRAVGLREVLLVSAVVVIVVLGAAALTGMLPTDLQRLVFHTPIAIGVLVVGTALVLWRVATNRPPEV